MTERAETDDALLALVDEAFRIAEADRAAAWERIRWDADAIAARLTETMVPAALRALGMRFEWTEER